MSEKPKKITRATIKSFIKKNIDNLYIKCKSSFDGMHDCCMPSSNIWKKAQKTDVFLEKNLGIEGAWFVGSSRDYLKNFEEEGFKGYYISNSCGSFILAIKENV